MQAFPVGSANMAMGGSGPVNKNIDLARVHGIGTEGYTDYGTGYSSYKKPEVARTVSFDPTARVEPVHGEESFGLGTSTFLDGAPASRKAIERRESESEQQITAGGGLSRKKSLAQRIRGMSQPRSRYEGGPIRSPESRYNGATSPESPAQPFNKIPATTITQSQSAGGPSKAITKEQNPFDSLYDEEYDKKGASIQAAEAEMEKENGRDRALSSPKRPLALERSVTTDQPTEEPKKEGFLSRVKSLKGRRPGRPN
jgi:Pal1 cell morphology protein